MFIVYALWSPSSEYVCWNVFHFHSRICEPRSATLLTLKHNNVNSGKYKALYTTKHARIHRLMCYISNVKVSTTTAHTYVFLEPSLQQLRIGSYKLVLSPLRLPHSRINIIPIYTIREYGMHCVGMSKTKSVTKNSLTLSEHIVLNGINMKNYTHQFVCSATITSFRLSEHYYRSFIMRHKRP